MLLKLFEHEQGKKQSLSKRKEIKIDSSSGFRAQIEILPIDQMDFSKKDVAGVIFQYPDTTGNIYDPSNFIARAKEHGV
jgi:glycine cleavage system pyridoxal-binding protein P